MSFIQWSYYFLGDTGPLIVTGVWGASLLVGSFFIACLINSFYESIEDE